jgi:hypothetical protein
VGIGSSTGRAFARVRYPGPRPPFQQSRSRRLGVFHCCHGALYNKPKRPKVKPPPQSAEAPEAQQAQNHVLLNFFGELRRHPGWQMERRFTRLNRCRAERIHLGCPLRSTPERFSSHGRACTWDESPRESYP